MRQEDVKYFSEFLKEFQEETDRGAALVGAALIDERLLRLLESHFLKCNESEELLKGVNSALGSLSSRIKIAYSLGLITKLEYQECEYIRRVRNEFAHKVHGLTFRDSKVHNLCKNLRANTPNAARFNGDARQLFVNSVILTSLAFWYRPEYSQSIMAKKHDWEYQLSPEKSNH